MQQNDDILTLVPILEAVQWIVDHGQVKISSLINNHVMGSKVHIAEGEAVQSVLDKGHVVLQESKQAWRM